MKDYVDTLTTTGGVHINSGIPNRAFAWARWAFGGKAWLKPAACGIWRSPTRSGTARTSAPPPPRR